MSVLVVEGDLLGQKVDENMGVQHWHPSGRLKYGLFCI